MDPARSKLSWADVVCCELSSQLTDPRSVSRPSPTFRPYEPDKSIPRTCCRAALMKDCENIAKTLSGSYSTPVKLVKTELGMNSAFCSAVGRHTTNPASNALTSVSPELDNGLTKQNVKM